MNIYTIACDAIRSAELAKRQLAKNTSLSVHLRSVDGTVVLTRSRTDRPEIISERVLKFDDPL